MQWRIEAEHKLIDSGKTGMGDAEITKFVEYFWKALHPELFMPQMVGQMISSRDRPLDRLLGEQISSDLAYADLIVEISRSHFPTKIYLKN